jgi:hypothetical protein
MTKRKKVVFNWNNPQTWIGQKFQCSFHPEGMNTYVNDVMDKKVFFSWVADGEFQSAVCTIDKFRRDFREVISD